MSFPPYHVMIMSLPLQSAVQNKRQKLLVTRVVTKTLHAHETIHILKYTKDK